jgi:hypothetical protein
MNFKLLYYRYKKMLDELGEPMDSRYSSFYKSFQPDVPRGW